MGGIALTSGRRAGASGQALSRLRHDHAVFSKLFAVLGRQAGVAAAGREPDVQLLRSIVSYLSAYPVAEHHPIEEVIYGHLVCHCPAMAPAMFNLIKDHHSLLVRTAELRRAVEGLEARSNSAREQFTDQARSFIAAQQEHLSVEESHFFPLAEHCLTPAQWAEVDRRVGDPLPYAGLPDNLRPLALQRAP